MTKSKFDKKTLYRDFAEVVGDCAQDLTQQLFRIPPSEERNELQCTLDKVMKELSQKIEKIVADAVNKEEE
jgi:hypothetical protein